MLCDSRTSPIMQIKFSFWSYEISENSLRNQKYLIGLDSFTTWLHLDNTSLCIDYPVHGDPTVNRGY